METSGKSSDNNTVIIKRLDADHGLGTFKEYKPLGAEMVSEIEKKLAAIFDELGGASLLKSSGDVYIKPNGVGGNPYVFTRTEVIEAAIKYWFKAGASNVYLFENSTQASFTRIIFELTGYNKVCKRTGAVPVYLDEDEVVPFEFKGKKSVEDGDPKGYALSSFGMPKTIVKNLIEDKDKNLYINMPKLKTHCMTVVTLGIKNQWGFPPHSDRGPDHNYNLHSKLVDVLSYVRPDVTLIEGVEGTIHGHYPALALADECVKPFKILVGSKNIVAADIVGAKIFGLEIDDVPHIKLAIERGLGDGVTTLDDVSLKGDFTDVNNIDVLNELEKSGGKYPYKLIQKFHDDVTVIKGSEMACEEGCVNNPLNNLQMLSLDHNGRGGWTLMMGKGFDDETINNINEPVLIAGPCAIKEVGDRLVARLGKKKVYFSRECNDLQATVEAMCHLMKVSPLKMAPEINPVKAAILILQAKLNGTSGKQVNIACNFIKLR